MHLREGMTIQIVKNCVAAGIYLLLRLLLQTAPEQTRLSIICVNKLRILLSLLAIPALTFLYVDDVLTYVLYYPAVMPPLPVLFYIACLAWLIFDVLREYNEIVEANKRTSKEDTLESSRE